MFWTTLPRTVFVLGLVSFFTDVSSEMIYPLLPVFLSTVLGASPLVLGTIEGFAELTAAGMKYLSGVWTDRRRERKPMIVWGYSVSSLVRPLIGIAGSWPLVFLIRIFDRIGKGVRSSPRDALIADSTPQEKRGAAFGFHRAMDHAGAVVGPILASVLLFIPGMQLRWVFLLAAVPGAIAVAVLVFGVREMSRVVVDDVQPRLSLTGWHELSRDFKIYLGAVLIFMLGNSSDAFLLMRLSEVGVNSSVIALLWSVHHVVKMAATFWGGRWSDRVGARKMIVAGWIFYSIVYILFAFVQSADALICLFIVYGIYYGLVEPAEKSLVVDLAPRMLTGTAFGYYHLISGISLLPASLVFGWIWKQAGASAAFTFGALLSILGSFLIGLLRSPRNAGKNPRLI